MFACLTFVIFGLVEFCVVIKIGSVNNSRKEKEKKRKEQRRQNCDRCKDLSTLFYRVGQLAKKEGNLGKEPNGIPDGLHQLAECSCEEAFTQPTPFSWINWEKLGGWVDTTCIALVPIAFFIFNISYWVTYEGLASEVHRANKA